MKRSGEVVQIGLDEADVFQPKLSAPTLGPDQRLLFVLYKDDLQEKKLLNNKITVKYHSNSKKYTQKETHMHTAGTHEEINTAANKASMLVGKGFQS